jgi:hypothetical protein
MSTWTNQSQETDEWTSQYVVLYLLTESNENMLDETGDLILLNQGGTGIYTIEAVPSDDWVDESDPVSGWTEKTVSSSVWS